jgi:hypothetical protein
MTPESDTTDGTLRWIQPDLTVQGYELRTPANSAIAWLRFAPSPTFARELRNPKPAVVEDGLISWSFSVRRPGWRGALGWSAAVAIAGPQRGELVARGFLTAGQLALDHGQAFVWRGSLARRGSSAFVSATSELLVTFEPGSFVDRVSTVVRLTAPAIPRSHMVLLVGLGLYLRLLMGHPYR